MGGKYSRSEFFKLYPSIIQSYFQSSDSTTPEEVKGIFEITEGRLDEIKKIIIIKKMIYQFRCYYSMN